MSSDPEAGIPKENPPESLAVGSTQDIKDVPVEESCSAPSTSLAPPDVSCLSISNDSTDGKRPARHPATYRSISDTSAQRLVTQRIASTQSSGSVSPLAHVQAARSGGIAARPPSSSGSSSSISGGELSKLPTGMQVKMMAVPPF
jgi:hypothetical protein